MVISLMYDCLHLRFTLRPDELGCTTFLESEAVQLGTFRKREPIRWQILHLDMRLDYWPDTGRGRIRGSLHTFYHGHNSGSFLATEVPDASQQLATTFDLPMYAVFSLHQGEVKNVEVGADFLAFGTALVRY